jgi:hypothetical protein
LVVPLRLRAGLTRSVALTRDGGHWARVDNQM